MSDEEVRELEAILELLEKVDDLRLDRDVERRDRFVADDELGLDRERAGDPDALALAARELVRIAVGEVRIQTHDAKQLLDALGLLFPAREGMDLERFADDVAAGHPRLQRRAPILNDHLHAPTHLPPVPPPQPRSP